MSVRAKFKVDEIRESAYISGYENNAEGKPDYSRPIKVKQSTIVASPVYGNGDPGHENTKFWKATPSGRLELGCVNPDAVKQFVIGEEYYVDFTPVRPG